MKLRYRQTGGYAGLVLGCDLDTDKLTAGEANELAGLLREAALNKIGVQKSATGRDLANYEIRVKEEGRVTKVTFDDMTIPGNVQPLLNFLRGRAQAQPLDD
jgi:hypothetical protein